MIEITKGNPTTEEIAALVAALALATATPSRRSSPTATDAWRRSTASVRVNSIRHGLWWRASGASRAVQDAHVSRPADRRCRGGPAPRAGWAQAARAAGLVGDQCQPVLTGGPDR